MFSIKQMATSADSLSEQIGFWNYTSNTWLMGAQIWHTEFFADLSRWWKLHVIFNLSQENSVKGLIPESFPFKENYLNQPSLTGVIDCEAK